jgi:ribosomal protein L11 methylase PrmA
MLASLLLLLLLSRASVCLQVAAVIGVDNVETAIADARVNAALNGITNATFVCDTAENAMEPLLKVRQACLNFAQASCPSWWPLFQQLLQKHACIAAAEDVHALRFQSCHTCSAAGQE